MNVIYRSVFNAFTNKYSWHWYSKRFIIKSTFKMNTAYFRHVDGDENFLISFRYVSKTLGIDKQINFCRRLEEPCSVFLNRIDSSISKLIEKKVKTKAKKSNLTEALAIPTIKATILRNECELSNDAPCSSILDTTGHMSIKIGDEKWNIEINAPWLDDIALPKSILATFPVYFSKFNGLFVDKNKCKFTWYKCKTTAGPWIECGKDTIYTPVADDIGHYLRVVCVPSGHCGRIGPAQEALSPCKVEASPGEFPFELRHKFTASPALDKEFRVVSYNILADMYVDSEYSRTVLFGYCSAYALELAYRRQLLLKELIGYNADLLCLQEVDSKVFRHDLQPIFGEMGYQAEFSQKGDTVSEGTAMIYNSKKFSSLKSWRHVLSELLPKEPHLADIWTLIQKNEALSIRLTQISTTLQILLLQSRSAENQWLLAANTHLYFHPDADHIRLLYGVVILKHLDSLLNDIKRENPDKNISLLICGDFNSVPECGIYELMTTGQVTADNIDWKSNQEEAIVGLSHRHCMKIASACGTPLYTNYTVGFKACIDYIFYQMDHLEVSQIVPLPTEEELSTHSGIPSVVFPSDHIALVSDLKWK